MAKGRIPITSAIGFRADSRRAGPNRGRDHPALFLRADVSHSDAVLSQLLTLVCDLYEDTEGFLERRDDAQLWYNRGYANGMVNALNALGYGPQVQTVIEPDAPALVADQALLPWGKAYAHGYQKGWRETQEVMGTH